LIRNEAHPEIDLVRQRDESGVFIHTSYPGISHPKKYESLIDSRYLDTASSETPYRIESYLSTGKVDRKAAPTTLRSYLVRICEFEYPSPTLEQKLDIDYVSDKNFKFRTTQNTKKLFQQVMTKVLDTDGPVLEVVETRSGEKRLIIGFRRRSTRNFFSALSDIFHYYGLASIRKHVDQFSNGVTIMTFYLVPATAKFSGSMEDVIPHVVSEASLLYTLPKNPLISFVQSGKLSGTIRSLSVLTFDSDGIYLWQCWMDSCSTFSEAVRIRI
jgi:glutamate dehydrogenase